MLASWGLRIEAAAICTCREGPDIWSYRIQGLLDVVGLALRRWYMAGLVGRTWAVDGLQGYLAYKKPPPLGTYSRTMPRLLWWSYGGGRFLTREVPL